MLIAKWIVTLLSGVCMPQKIHYANIMQNHKISYGTVSPGNDRLEVENDGYIRRAQNGFGAGVGGIRHGCGRMRARAEFLLPDRPDIRADGTPDIPVRCT